MPSINTRWVTSFNMNKKQIYLCRMQMIYTTADNTKTTNNRQWIQRPNHWHLQQLVYSPHLIEPLTVLLEFTIKRVKTAVVINNHNWQSERNSSCDATKGVDYEKGNETVSQGFCSASRGTYIWTARCLSRVISLLEVMWISIFDIESEPCGRHLLQKPPDRGVNQLDVTWRTQRQLPEGTM